MTKYFIEKENVGLVTVTKDEFNAEKKRLNEQFKKDKIYQVAGTRAEKPRHDPEDGELAFFIHIFDLKRRDINLDMRFDEENLSLIIQRKRPKTCNKGDCEWITRGTVSEMCESCLKKYTAFWS